MRPAFFAAAAVLLAGVLSPPGPRPAGLPIGYGGNLRLAATAPLRAPSPQAAATPLEASVANAVFDGLYRLGAGGPRPVLAHALPERVETPGEESSLLVRIRPGVRRHRGGGVNARLVLQALQDIARGRAAPWLGDLVAEDGSLRVDMVDGMTLRFPDIGPRTLATRLAAAPLALRFPRGRGTGPYYAVLGSSGLSLRHFRWASRGAPYLWRVELSAPEPREAELRRFELGELDGSWRGPGLYGERAGVRERELPSQIPLVLHGLPTDRPLLAAIARRLERRRLARVGLRASARLHPSLPPPELGEASSRNGAVLRVRTGDQLQERAARALAAQLDERGFRLRVESTPSPRATAGTFVLSQVLPTLPGPDPMAASALLASGGESARRRARELVSSLGTRRVRHEAEASPEAARVARTFPGLVLGVHAPHLWLRDAYRGVDQDLLGRIRFGDIFLPRSESDQGRRERDEESKR